jgi:hypothetical protein
MTNFFIKINFFLKFLLIILFLSSASCIKFKKIDARKDPLSGPERAVKNVNEGRGVSINNARKGGLFGGGSYEFSTSNPMWRASLELIDFVPLTTVDYSGGIIITDWYSDSFNSKESIKITIRFLSNEIRSDSFKILVHKRLCKAEPVQCNTALVKDSKIESELRKVILQKASALDKEK